ncbi:MAG: precorrin-6A reductase [Oscillatoriales cyanobacterium]|nr:MAG: precorrin-6A reductase [Oscillatoriales cyanobacterium]
MLWLIGGTSDSRTIAQALDRAGLPWIATVVNPAATRLYAGLAGSVRSGAFAAATLIPWLTDQGIQGIIDASHPFATAISQEAIAAAAVRSIPYLRFERPAIPLEPPALGLPSLEAALSDRLLAGRRVLFTLGVKSLPSILPWRDRVAALWVRVLPESVDAAIALGFDRAAVIGQRLPVDPAQERADWQNRAIEVVVTKAAGAAGGLDLKQAIARELGVQLLVIDRPAISYPAQTDRLDVLVAFGQRAIG